MLNGSKIYVCRTSHVTQPASQPLQTESKVYALVVGCHTSKLIQLFLKMPAESSSKDVTKVPNIYASVHQTEELYMAAVPLRMASVLLVLLPGSVLFHADV
jgi:hypothetical protein